MTVVRLGCALLLVLGASAMAEVTHFSVDSELQFAYGADRDAMQQGDLLLRPELELDLTESVRFKGSARLRWAANDDLGRSRGGDLESYDPASRPWQQGQLRAELRDFTLDLDIGPGLLRLGKQQIVWGAMDGLKLLDALNPQDFREFILDDFDQSRISQWGAYLEWPMAGGALEVVALPDRSKHELPLRGSNFDLTAPRYRFGLNGASSAGLNIDNARSGHAQTEATFGLRYSRFSGGWDLAASVIVGPDHLPVAAQALGPSGPALKLQYHQRNLIGVTAARSIGPFAFRMELAWRPDRGLNRTTRAGGVEIVRRDQFGVALGLDWQAPLDLFVNLQLLHEQTLAYDPSLVVPRKDTIATSLVRRQFRYETLTAELRWYGNLADGDGLFRPSVSYALGDNTFLRLGADLFYGAATGIFGQFNEQDQVSLMIRRVF